MKLIFELGVEGRGMTLMPECDVPEYQLPEERSEALHLPHVSENELTRHYTTAFSCLPNPACAMPTAIT